MGTRGSPALPRPGPALAMTPACLGRVSPFRLGVWPFPSADPGACDILDSGLVGEL